MSDSDICPGYQRLLRAGYNTWAQGRYHTTMGLPESPCISVGPNRLQHQGTTGIKAYTNLASL